MIINRIIIEYKAKLVKVKLMYPNIGALIPIKLVTSNCSKGEFTIEFKIMFIIIILFFSTC